MQCSPPDIPLHSCMCCLQYVADGSVVIMLQESLEQGCKNVDDVVASFSDVGIKDRSMVWNTDLIEVGLSLLLHYA